MRGTKPTGFAKPLPLGEVSPKVTERARMLTVIRGRSDSIALTKSMPIAAWAVLSRRACPLSRFAPALPKGEPFVEEERPLKKKNGEENSSPQKAPLA